MHILSGVLPVLYVLARVTPGGLVAHQHLFTASCCGTSQYELQDLFEPFSISMEGS